MRLVLAVSAFTGPGELATGRSTEADSLRLLSPSSGEQIKQHYVRRRCAATTHRASGTVAAGPGRSVADAAVIHLPQAWCRRASMRCSCEYTCSTTPSAPPSCRCTCELLLRRLHRSGGLLHREVA